MAEESPQDSAGPSSPPPRLPEGWLAQWEGVSRKWYFVQRATGKSQWEIPTEPVALTPSTTPNSIGMGPTNMPQSRSQTLSPRGFVGDQARAFGLDKAGLASIFNSKASQHGGGLGQVAVGMLSKLSDQLFNDKPNNQSQNAQTGNYTGQYPQYQQGGYGNYSHSNPYGYSSTGNQGTYSGNAPQYNPPSQTTVYSPSAQGPPPPYTGPPPHYNPPSQSSEYHSPSQSSASATYSGSAPQYNPPGQGQPPNGNSYQSQDGYNPHYGPDSHGNVSSQFNQASPLQIHTGQSSTNVSTTNQYSGTASSSPHVSQPEWQMGSQPPIPQSTKPSHGKPHQSVPASPAQSSLGQYPSQQAGYPPQQYSQGQPYPQSQYPGAPNSSHPGQAGGDQQFQHPPPPPQSAPQYGQPPPADMAMPGSTPGFHGSTVSPSGANDPGSFGNYPHFNPNTQYPQPYQGPQQASPFPAAHPPAPPASAATYSPNPSMPPGPSDTTQPYPPYGAGYPIGNQLSGSGQLGVGSDNQHNAHNFAVELADTSVPPSGSRPQTQQSTYSDAGSSSHPYAGNFNPQQPPLPPPSYHQGNPNGSPYNTGAPQPPPGPQPPHHPAMSDSQFVSGPWTSTPSPGGSQHPQPPYGYGYPGYRP